MIKPFIRAFSAVAYIAILVLLISSFEHIMPQKDTIFTPMLALSLFVLSTAMMGYLFFFDPVRLYAEGHKEEAVQFFLKTLGSFGIFIIIFIIVLFLGI